MDNIIQHQPGGKALGPLGKATSLFSDNVKTVAIGSKLQLGRLNLLSEPLFLGGSPLQRPKYGAFIRLLGRHALPHHFHRQDLAKFMKAGAGPRQRSPSSPCQVTTLSTCTMVLPEALSTSAPK